MDAVLRVTGRVTPDEVEEIVRLKLAHVSSREVARRTGRDRDTVQKHWDRYCDELVRESSDRLEPVRAAHVAQLEAIAADAYRDYLALQLADEPKPADLANAQRTRLTALAQLAKVRGLEISKVELSGTGGGPVAIEWTETVVRPEDVK